jgi:hypothetical protein
MITALKTGNCGAPDYARLRSFHRLKNNVSSPYKTAGIIIFS